MYEVIVGNIGIVYSGDCGHKANVMWETYVKQSLEGSSRCSGENIFLMRNGEVVKEHRGSISD